MEELISGCESGLQPSYKFFLSYFNKLCGEAYQNKLFLDYSTTLFVTHPFNACTVIGCFISSIPSFKGEVS